MGRSSTTYAKRQKEIAQQERARDKSARRVVRRDEKEAREPGDPDIDADIAGIVPGPQPIVEDDYTPPPARVRV